MAKRKIRVHDESLNAYGFWVKTSGGDLNDFKKNPICLWNHHQSWRGTTEEVLPIGRWTELEILGSEITAVPVFDTNDEFADKVGKKYEEGFLNAASIGITILEWSEDPALLKPGQTRPTVTKWRLREISIVDIPANKNAVCFYDQGGNMINLSEAGADADLEKIGMKMLSNALKPKLPAMENEFKLAALALGLKDNATHQQVLDEIQKLKEKAEKATQLESELSLLKAVEDKRKKEEQMAILNEAVSDNRITAAQRLVYEKLFEADFDSAKAVLDGLPKHQKLSEVPAGQVNQDMGFTYQGKTYDQLTKENPALLAQLKANDFNTFNQLYKAHYGTDFKK